MADVANQHHQVGVVLADLQHCVGKLLPHRRCGQASASIIVLSSSSVGMR
jgi:hypothetical protein